MRAVVRRAEIAQAVENRIGGGLSKAAMARRLKHAIEAFDLDEIERRSIPLLELVETIAQHRGPDAAGRAEAAAFMREEMHEVARDREHVATPVEHHQGARRGRVLECDAALEIHAAPASFRRPRRAGRLAYPWRRRLPELPRWSRRTEIHRRRARRNRRTPTAASCRSRASCLFERTNRRHAPRSSCTSASVSTLLTLVGWPR